MVLQQNTNETDADTEAESQESTSGELAIADTPKDTIALSSAQGFASLFLFGDEIESLMDTDEVAPGLEEIKEELVSIQPTHSP